MYTSAPLNIVEGIHIEMHVRVYTCIILQIVDYIIQLLAYTAGSE